MIGFIACLLHCSHCFDTKSNINKIIYKVMKKLIFIFIVASVFSNFFLSKEVVAQTCGIDSIYIIPENPTEFDSLQIICIATFYSGPVYIYSMDISVEDNTIKMFMKYFQSGFTVITTVVDTLEIGTYVSGDYKLVYDVESYFFNDYVVDPILMATCKDSLVFSVQGENFISEDENKSISIYPNPFKNIVFISTNNVGYVEIFDVFGRTVYYSEINIGINEISTSYFLKGIYFIKIHQKDNSINSFKIIKL